MREGSLAAGEKAGGGGGLADAGRTGGRVETPGRKRGPLLRALIRGKGSQGVIEVSRFCLGLQGHVAFPAERSTPRLRQGGEDLPPGPGKRRGPPGGHPGEAGDAGGGEKQGKGRGLREAAGGRPIQATPERVGLADMEVSGGPSQGKGARACAFSLLQGNLVPAPKCFQRKRKGTGRIRRSTC